LHWPQFFFWKKKLSEAAEPTILQAMVTEQQAVSASVACVGIEVRLRGGYSLLIEPGFDAGHLRALLAVLESGS
jgi:hypothetical protein